MNRIKYIDLGIGIPAVEFSKKELDRIVRCFEMISYTKSQRKKNKYENIVKKMYNRKMKIMFNSLSEEQKISLLNKKEETAIMFLPYKNYGTKVKQKIYTTIVEGE